MAETASITITGDSSRAVRALNTFDRSLSRANTLIDRNQRATARAIPTQQKAATAFKATASALTAFALTNRIRSVITDVVALASRFVELSAATGIAVPTLQLFGRVLQEDGISADQANKSIQRLFIRIGEARRGVARPLETLQALGLTFEEINALSPDRLFFRVANSLSQLSTDYQLATFSADLFGARNIQAGTTIARYGDQLEDAFNRQRAFGLVTADNAASLKDLGQTLTDVGNRLEAALSNAIAGLSTEIGDITDSISTQLANGINLASRLLERFSSDAGTTSRDLAILRNILVALVASPIIRGITSLFQRLYNGIRRIATLRNLTVGGIAVGFQSLVSQLTGAASDANKGIEEISRDQINTSADLRELFGGEVNNLNDIATRLQITQNEITDIRNQAAAEARRISSTDRFLESDFFQGQLERYPISSESVADFARQLNDPLVDLFDDIYDSLGFNIAVDAEEAAAIFVNNITARLRAAQGIEQFQEASAGLGTLLAEREQFFSLQDIDTADRLAQKQEQILANRLASSNIQDDIARSAEETVNSVQEQVNAARLELELLQATNAEKGEILAKDQARIFQAQELESLEQTILNLNRERDRALAERAALERQINTETQRSEISGSDESADALTELQKSLLEVSGDISRIENDISVYGGVLASVTRDGVVDVEELASAFQDLIDLETRLAEVQEAPARDLASRRAILEAEAQAAGITERIAIARQDVLRSINQEADATRLQTELLGLQEVQVAEIVAAERARLETARLQSDIDRAISEARTQVQRAELDVQAARKAGAEDEERSSRVQLSSLKEQLRILEQFRAGQISLEEFYNNVYQATLRAEQATIDFARAQDEIERSQDRVNMRFENFRSIVDASIGGIVQLFEAAVAEGEKLSDVLRDIAGNLGRLLLNRAFQSLAGSVFPSIAAGGAQSSGFASGSASPIGLVTGAASSSAAPSSGNINVFVPPGASPEDMRSAAMQVFGDTRNIRIAEVADDLLTLGSQTRTAVGTI